MGYAVVDMLVARIDGLRDGPVLQAETLQAMRDRLAAAPPAGPNDFADLLARLDQDVLPYVGHFDHPRFFGYIPGAGTWPAALGDLIAAATNIDAGSWRESVGPSTLELTVLDWFREWIDYPHSAAGVLVGGGSAANLTAIACAREALIGPMSPRIVMYTGDQTHSSVARAARHLGFRPDQLRVLPTDDDFRLRTPTSPRPSTPISRLIDCRSWSAPTPDRRIPAPSTRSASSPTCATTGASGFTWTAPTAPSRS